MERKGLERQLKLVKSLPKTNMHAFDAQGKLKKFDRPEDIIEAFFPVRLDLYEDRKSVLLSEAEYRALTLRNKARFIQMVVSGDIELVGGNASISMMTARLEELGFDSSSKLEKVKNNNSIGKRTEQRMTGEEADPFNYSYILRMPVESFTSERIGELEEEANKKERVVKEIRAMTARELWHQDLDRLVPFLPK